MKNHSDRIRVEFIIDAYQLGNIVLLVEQIGATDFAFVTLKDVPKPQKKKRGKYAKKVKKNGKRKKAAPSPSASVVLEFIRKKGTVNRHDIARALEEGGKSSKSMPGVIWKLERDGMIVPLKRGSGMFQLAKAGRTALENGAYNDEQPQVS